MGRHVRKVAVLGSGVMGSAIAAHFTNTGVPALVLDIVPPELDAAEQAAGLGRDDRRVRDRIARTSVAALVKSRPPALFSRDRLAMIEVGNLEDDLPRLAEADWVIEVVREDMGIKKRVFEAIAPHVAPHAVLSSNTSGLSLGEMAEVLPAELRPRFLGTHFFNPPRYMRLLELIPTAHTSAEVCDRVAAFASGRLGKGVVRAKDTPNFIANRIGVHSMMVTAKVMEELGLDIEEIDAITGPAMGRPKTATFRLADLVGLDTLLLVAGNVHQGAADDESRELFVPPEFLAGMVERGLLGRKSGAGFYRKEGKKILTLDLATLDYREPKKVALAELGELKRTPALGERLRKLVSGDGPAGQAAWKMLAGTMSYSALRLGEIADDAEAIDRAMRLGFNWQMGPFETWDALGFRETTERMQADGFALPEWVSARHAAGATSLFEWKEQTLVAPTATAGRSVEIPADPSTIKIELLRRAGREVKSNRSASLLDLGDGVLGLEFHSKMNAIDADTVAMMHEAVDEAEANWRALVVANDGENFSAGANLMMLAEQARSGNWEAIREMIIAFQGANDRLERAAVPTVTAPHGMVLGGGCEVSLAGSMTRPAAELYIGLVEVGAGLIPAGGGCMRLYRRNVARLADPGDVYTALRGTFDTIGMAKVSGSAEEARGLGYVRPAESWSMNRDHLLADAKAVALAAAGSGYTPPSRPPLPVMGRGGMALIEAGLLNMFEGRFISEHDRKIGRELAGILSGGDVAGPTTVSEAHLLELEQEAFLRLSGEPKTHERIQALLETGKPLRN